MDMSASAAAARSPIPDRDLPPENRGLAPSTLACALLLAVALAMFALNVHHGIGIFPDTTRYMGISPTPYDAPVYHWMLVAGPALGVSLLTAAMVTAVIALCANVILIFALVRRGSGDWRLAALATALSIMAPQFVTLHSAAMSEAPFITFLLATIWFALDYLEHGRRRDLLLAGVLLGVATLTRFTAPPLGAAIALAILARPGIPLSRRIADCVLLALVSGALFFGWVAWSTETNGHSIGRELRFYGNMDAHQWRNNMEALAAWVFPDQVPLVLRLALLAALTGFIAWQTVRQWQVWRTASGTATGPAAPLASRAALSLILALFLVLYLAFVWLSSSLEANLGLSGRYAFPAYVVFVVLICVEASGLDRSRSAGRTAALALGGLAVLVLGAHTLRSAVRTEQVYRDGYGYHARLWRESPTIAAVGKLPANAVLYANSPEVIALLDNRPSLSTPHERLLRTNLPEPGNPASRQIAAIRARAAQGDAPVFLVFFDNIDWRFYLTPEERIARALALPDPIRLSDGRIYRVPPPPTSRP